MAATGAKREERGAPPPFIKSTYECQWLKIGFGGTRDLWPLSYKNLLWNINIVFKANYKLICILFEKKVDDLGCPPPIP